MLNAVANKITYDISLSSTPLAAGYEVTFPFFNDDEIKVYITNRSGMSLVDSGYFHVDKKGITPVVKFIPSYVYPDESTRLTLARLLTVEQLVDLRNGDVMDAETLEESLDRLTAIAQQMDEQLERCVLIPISESATLTIPPLQWRKDMLLGFDADGNVIGVLTSDIEQKLAAALDAEEKTLAAEASAQQSASDAHEFAVLSDEIRKQALAEITVAKDAVLQAIQEAEDAGLLSLVERAEALTVELDSIAYRIKYSEDNANIYAGYAHEAAITATNKALESQRFADRSSGAAKDATNEAEAAKNAKEQAAISAQFAAENKAVTDMNREDTAASRTAALNSQLSAQGAKDAAVAAKDNAAVIYESAGALYAQMLAVASQVATPTILIGGVLYTQETWSKRGRVFEKLTPATGD